MGLAFFGNQWVAATYIGAVGDIVPQQLAGRVNGIAGFGDSSSTLRRGAAHRRDCRSLLVHAGVHRRRRPAAARDGQRILRHASHRAGELPESVIPDRSSRIPYPDPDSLIPHPASRIPDPRIPHPHPESRIPDPHPESAKSRVAESRTESEDATMDDRWRMPHAGAGMPVGDAGCR